MTLQDSANVAFVKVITFNDILSPLILAIAKHIGVVNSKDSCDVEALLLAKLVENVVMATNNYMDDRKIDSNDPKKWIIAANVSRIVAANYKKNKDLLDSDFAGVNLEEEEEMDSFASEEDFKNTIFEAMSPIADVVKRFNFAIEDKDIVSGSEKQITTYANNLFFEVDRKSLEKGQFNHLYVKAIRNLSEIFSTCYYNSIDATLSIPVEQREPFIQKHMIDSSDSADKLLDSFYARVSIISNISIALGVSSDHTKA
jgi:hypothetical protein